MEPMLPADGDSDWADDAAQDDDDSGGEDSVSCFDCSCFAVMWKSIFSVLLWLMFCNLLSLCCSCIFWICLPFNWNSKKQLGMIAGTSW